MTQTKGSATERYADAIAAEEQRLSEYIGKYEQRIKSLHEHNQLDTNEGNRWLEELDGEYMPFYKVMVFVAGAFEEEYYVDEAALDDFAEALAEELHNEFRYDKAWPNYPNAFADTDLAAWELIVERDYHDPEGWGDTESVYGILSTDAGRGWQPKLTDNKGDGHS